MDIAIIYFTQPLDKCTVYALKASKPILFGMTIPHWYVYRIDVLCLECGEKSFHRIGEMIGQDSIPCEFCKEPIDISTSEWRTAIQKHADAYSEISFSTNKRN